MLNSSDELHKKAQFIRAQTLKMIYKAGSGHPGGSLSAADLLVGLYYREMRLYANPQDERRDRFVLSKGHANPPLYAILADLGYFSEKTLWTLRGLGSKLPGHPDMRKTPGIDCSTGSLGQGISVATGMALSLKVQNRDNRVYVLTGDGELQEGIAWESFMAASHYQLNNLTVIVDCNHLQLDGATEKIMDLGNLKNKFSAFGFNAVEINGHNFDEIIPALHKRSANAPVCIIANTVKGKGVSFMENQYIWHGGTLSDEQLQRAMAELEEK